MHERPRSARSPSYTSGEDAFLAQQPAARHARRREHRMKLGIIGVGAVGSATAMAAALRARVREIVLIDRDRARAKAVATDMHYGVALSPLVSIREGDDADLPDGALRTIPAGGT